MFGTLRFHLNKLTDSTGVSRRVCRRRRAGLRLLRMLGLCEGPDDAHAALVRLLRQLRQLLGQLRELWGGEAAVVQQLPAALQTLGGVREPKQEAL